MSLAERQITIVGAGVAGLAVARALALKGARVTVLDQAEAVREIGAGLQISPNGVAVLDALGLGDGLRRLSQQAEAVHLIDGHDGRVVTRLDVARLRPGRGWHFLHRADLIALLLDGAREAGVELRLLQKLEHVDLSGAQPRLEMGTGAVIDAELVIGADGIKSVLRRAIEGEAAPRFTRQVAWRAIIPEDPGGPSVAEVHMGAGRHIVSYPLRGGTMRNIVAAQERSTWVAESWSHHDSPSELRVAFGDFCPRVQGWLERVDQVGLWGLFRHPVATHWYRSLPQGMAVLMGDAAHPTLPFLAQGANMALEDAWVLAEELASVDGNDFVPAMQRYREARKGRTRRIVDAASRNAAAYHLSGPVRMIAHAGLRLGGKIAPGAALKRFDWLYQHDVTRPR